VFYQLFIFLKSFDFDMDFIKSANIYVTYVSCISEVEFRPMIITQFYNHLYD